MRTSGFGTVIKIVLGLLALALVVGGIFALKSASEEDGDALPDTEVVIDEKSGISWKMHGEPTMVESTSDLVLGVAKGTEVTVRTYTVDHGDWVERVRVFDVAPGEIDFTSAARTVFDSPEDEEFGDVEYIKVDKFSAATGAMDGKLSKDGDDADTQVFASQMNSFMVTGGVAQQEGASTVDITDLEERLRGSVEAA